MRKKIFDDNFNVDNEFYQPTQIDLGTAEKDVTEPIETPKPLAKGFDGLPKFNELQEAQKKSMPKAMRSQVAFQQKKLQYNNYQILTMQIAVSDSTTPAASYLNEYNDTINVGTEMDSGVLFGTSTADVTKAKYYNIVYVNARFSPANVAGYTINSPSFIEFYIMQKLPSGDFGGKIPRQIEAVANSNGTQSIGITGKENGVQSFGVDFYNENAYYTQSPDLKGIRTCGLALKKIVMNFGSAIKPEDIKIDVEVGYDLKTEGNNL